MQAATDLANYGNNPTINLKESTPKGQLACWIKRSEKFSSEKIEITDHYKDLLLREKNIQGCEIIYGDTERKVILPIVEMK